jgi:hypothetical protein
MEFRPLNLETALCPATSFHDSLGDEMVRRTVSDLGILMSQVINEPPPSALDLEYPLAWKDIQARAGAVAVERAVALMTRDKRDALAGVYERLPADTVWPPTIKTAYLAHTSSSRVVVDRAQRRLIGCVAQALRGTADYAQDAYNLNNTLTAQPYRSPLTYMHRFWHAAACAGFVV